MKNTLPHFGKAGIGFLFLIFTITNCFSQPSNTNLSSTTYYGGEPYLVVNPGNPKNMVVAWMALDVSTAFKMSIKSKTSFDGGATWGNPFVQPHFGPGWGSADASMQFRANGTVYLSYIDYRKSPDSGGVYVCNSTNGGIAWSAPTQVWNVITEDPSKVPLDRPWLTVDNSGTSSNGMFYITTKPAPWIAPPNRPYLKRSSDNGQTWSPYRFVDTTNYLVGSSIAAPMGFPSVTADGALCIAYPSYVTSQSLYPKILLAKSYNKGAGFLYYDLAISTAPVLDTLYKLGYRLTTNPANANQLAFAFVAKPDGDPDVFVTTSNNGGLNWNIPVRVNDDTKGNGKAQDMVWASYDNAGKLAVTWRDRRNAGGTGFYQPSDTYCAVSTDNGNTFKTNIRLSNITSPFDTILGQLGNDFLSCEFLNDTIYAAWGDVRSGKLNVYFAKTSYSTGSGTGVISIDSAPSHFNVYPNPASDKLVIIFNDTRFKQIDLKLFNDQGKEVLCRQIETGAQPTVIPISNFSKGIYFISASFDKKNIYTNKILISR